MRVDLGDRDQMVAAEPAALALDAALLVGALDAGMAVERLEAVVGPERHPAGRLGAVAAEQHPRHRRLQVVVADVEHRGPAEGGERGLMAFQERLLPLGGVGPVHRLARERQPQREQEDLRADPGQIDPQVREVDLGLARRARGSAARTRPRAALPAAAQISGRRFAT